MATKRSLSTILMVMVALSLVLGVGASYLNATAPQASAQTVGDAIDVDGSVDNCRGTIKIHIGDSNDEAGGNDPKVCEFHLYAEGFFGYDWIKWGIYDKNSGDLVRTGTFRADYWGKVRGPVMSLPAGHYKLVWISYSCDPWMRLECSKKHKVFKSNCVPTPTPTNTPTKTNTPKPTNTPEPTATKPAPTATSTAEPYVEPTRTAEPEIRPTLTPLPDGRSNIAVLCQGCWDNQATLWVGGTEQTTIKFVPAADGWPAVNWILWNDVPWEIRIAVTMPPNLDESRWRMLLWVGTGPEDFIWTQELTDTINPGDNILYDFQLVDLEHWQYHK